MLREKKTLLYSLYVQAQLGSISQILGSREHETVFEGFHDFTL